MLNNAREVLRRACTPHGIVAFVGEETDNYARIWARDAVISGLAGCMLADECIKTAFKKSILTLLKAQKKQGQLPSNVLVDVKGNLQQISYGTMAARIDAITWWLIGAATVADFASQTEKESIYVGVEKTIDLLETLEYNGRGLIYTPIGGNWADEYVTHGYTLYDQLLRFHALELAAQTWQRTDWQEKAQFIAQVIAANYWQPQTLHQNPYRYRPLESDTMKQLPNVPYWLCSISPTGYDARFDLLANALALLSPFCNEQQASSVLQYGEMLMKQNKGLIPSFYPIIQSNSQEWEILRANYLYRFKNMPGCFHNGGIWLMTLGWWGKAAAKWNRTDLAKQLLQNITPFIINHTTEEKNKCNFFEYLSSLNYTIGGLNNLSFSAAGFVLLTLSANKSPSD